MSPQIALCQGNVVVAVTTGTCFIYDLEKPSTSSSTSSTSSNAASAIDIVDHNHLKSKGNQVDSEAKGFALAMSFSHSGAYFALCNDYKQVLLYETYNGPASGWKLLSTRSSPKKGIQITFQLDDSCLLLADKFGDVVSYSCQKPDEEGSTILGHLSMLTDVALLHKGGLIATADRDEKIRVSHYPNTYNIQAFCLGHMSFITSIIEVGSLLASSAGDGYLKLWDPMTGQLLSSVSCDVEGQFIHQMIFSEATNTIYCLITQSTKMLKVSVKDKGFGAVSFEELSAPGVWLCNNDSLVLVLQHTENNPIKVICTDNNDNSQSDNKNKDIVRTGAIDVMNSDLSKKWDTFSNSYDEMIEFYTNLTKMNLDNVAEQMERKGKRPPLHIQNEGAGQTKLKKLAC